MKNIILTDISTHLCKGLINQYGIYEINNSKSPIGQILYSVDQLASNSFDIVYLCGEENYSIINEICLKIARVHSLSSITVINLDSCSKLGRNNLALKLATGDIKSLIADYELEYNVLFDEQYNIAINALTKKI